MARLPTSTYRTLGECGYGEGCHPEARCRGTTLWRALASAATNRLVRFEVLRDHRDAWLLAFD